MNIWGRYYSNYYKQLAADQTKHTIDFRGLRFPGLISAVTLPTGGTSDYGPEMLHHAAQNLPYSCFVRPDSILPFMVMPDAVKSIIMLENAERESLSQLVYNVTSFSTSAENLKRITTKIHFQMQIFHFPLTKKDNALSILGLLKLMIQQPDEIGIGNLIMIWKVPFKIMSYLV